MADILLAALWIFLLVVAAGLILVAAGGGNRRGFRTGGRTYVVEARDGALLVRTDGPVFVQWYEGRNAFEVRPL